MKKLVVIFTLILLFSVASPLSYALSTTTYNFTDYGFDSGGSNNQGTTTYNILDSSGEVDQNSLNTTSYNIAGGFAYDVQVNIPGTPTIANTTGSYYNQLHIVIDNGSNPADTVFQIAISTDAFATNLQYIKNDDTLTSTINGSTWQTYAGWGSSSGFNVIGLTPGVTYTIKVSARQGAFTQSPYSATAAAATISPTMSFNLTPNIISLGTLTPGSVATSPTATATITTNATNGGTIYVYDANSGLQSTATSGTISSVTSDLTAVSQGYGVQSTAVTQTSGGPMEAISPYAGAGGNVGILDSTKRALFDSTGAPVTSGQGTFALKARPSSTTPAATDYADTLTVIAAGGF